jgi:hypothetical protein
MTAISEVQHTVPPEADWDKAQGLFEGGDDLILTPEECGLPYWFANVPQGTLRGHVLGHAPEVATPELVREPGILHDALLQELAFRTLAEERTARSLSYLVLLAPDHATMDFYATQLLDETRHALIFRQHMLDLGVAEQDRDALIEELAGQDARSILQPLEEYVMPFVQEQHDFVAGVVMLTTLVEGVLAPAFEMSERKWRPLNPAMADIEKGAGIDEVRHLAVGATIVRRHIKNNPEDADRLAGAIKTGMELFAGLPVLDQLVRWEAMFQEGMAQHADVIGDYEIWAGRRLLDSTPDERIGNTFELTARIHANRLTEMGLGAALS